MVRAIVYSSYTGHTKEYAGLLGKATSLPVYELKDAEKELPRGTETVYLGWLMAGTVRGYDKAMKLFDIKALCSVGMSEGSAQLADMKKVNHLPESLPVFYLPGGFEMDKLHGIYKLMMKTMKATVGKKLVRKENRTREESEMLDLLLHGGNCVSIENLHGILCWLGEN